MLYAAKALINCAFLVDFLVSSYKQYLQNVSHYSIILDFCFSYLISAFFHRTIVAAFVGVLVFLMSYMPFVVILTLRAELAFWHRIIAVR